MVCAAHSKEICSLEERVTVPIGRNVFSVHWLRQFRKRGENKLTAIVRSGSWRQALVCQFVKNRSARYRKIIATVTLVDPRG